ncbi:MAG: undecaprenyl-diphosphatase UppP [Bacilli bacterium]|nr:undecaprenyl-diphosphatase UppP [Bacilli bacterium]
MEFLQSILLGIIQGIAEFLPISSSAHLIIAREVFNIGSFIGSNVELTFDLALHFGTLLAIVVYFFSELWKLLTEGITKGNKTTNGRLFWYLILATVPAAIVGVLFEDVIDSFFRRQIWLIAIALIVMGIIIYYIDKISKSDKDMKSMKWKDALLIGCAQVFALIPGFSRSGTTITASRALGINKEDSAKFSFYLSIPVVAGGALLSLIKDNTLVIISENLVLFGLGILISFITGLLCISFLLKYLRKHDFKLFMYYRILIGIIVLLTLIF